jgi:hypothetical protein
MRNVLMSMAIKNKHNFDTNEIISLGTFRHISMYLKIKFVVYKIVTKRNEYNSIFGKGKGKGRVVSVLFFNWAPRHEGVLG